MRLWAEVVGEIHFMCANQKANVMRQTSRGQASCWGVWRCQAPPLQAHHSVITAQRSQPPAQVSLRPREPTSQGLPGVGGPHSMIRPARQQLPATAASTLSGRGQIRSSYYHEASLWWAVTGVRRHRFTNIHLRLNVHASGGNRCSPTIGFSHCLPIWLAFPIA